MARRGTKKKDLTPEEKLAQALVPVEEQPYEVPGNWCWVTVGGINQYNSGSIDPSQHPDTVFELYSVPSSAEDYPEIISGKDIGSTKQVVIKGDVLLCKINPRINRVWKVSQHTYNPLLASSEWIIVRNHRIDSDYLMNCFRSEYFRDYMLSNVSGVGGSLMRAQPKYVKGYPVPVPPLPEQQRIVARIESLFAKLDEAKEKAQTVVDGFEERKAAILHQAFTGELTNNKKTVEHISILQLVKPYKEALKAGPFGSALRKDMYVREGYKIYGQEQVINGDETIGEYYIDEEKYRELYSCRVSPRDVLISLVGTVGKVLVLSNDCLPGIINPRLIKVSLDEEKMIPEYFKYYFESDYIRSLYKNDAHGTTMDVLNMRILKGLPFPKVSIEEQTEIVHILDSLLDKQQQARDSAAAVLDQIDTMKKAILARAFRGELGTNDPAEESAVELVRRALDE